MLKDLVSASETDRKALKESPVLARVNASRSLNELLVWNEIFGVMMMEFFAFRSASIRAFTRWLKLSAVLVRFS